MIFTIGRQVGSGGRIVGRRIAEKLGLAFYDREILQRAAKESGIRSEFFQQTDERNTLWGRFTSFFMSDHLLPADNCLSSQSLFKYQSDAIRRAATEGKGAVFVGRCSDYVLRDFDNRLDVFVTASLEERIARTVTYYNVSPDEAARKIREMESARAEFYNFYTEKHWGATESYHLCIDSTSLDMDALADYIIGYAKLTGRLQ